MQRIDEIRVDRADGARNDRGVVAEQQATQRRDERQPGDE
jgi:hypothetical protein